MEIRLTAQCLAILSKAVCGRAGITAIHAGLNQLTALPDWLANLPNLAILNLNHNRLTELPENFARLTALRELNLSSNPLGSFPAELKALANLKILRIAQAGLRELPMDFPGTQLTEFHADRNEIESLPDGIANGPAGLRRLGLAQNRLRSLSACLDGWKKLR